MKSIFTFILIVILTISHCYAQERLGTAGMQQNNVSWSIGELVNETGTVNNMILAQGFNQQITDIFSGLKQVSNSFFSFYPNPVLNTLQLKLNDNYSYSWSLTDLVGRVVKQKLSCVDMQIDMSDMTSGQYILSIVTDQFKQSVIVVKN